MDPISLPCGKCHGRTFSRIAYSHEGSVLEYHCPYDGWSKPVAISLLGQEPMIPSDGRDVKELSDKRAEAGRAGGLASRNNGALARNRAKVGRKHGKRIGVYQRRALALLVGLMLLSGCASYKHCPWPQERLIDHPPFCWVEGDKGRVDVYPTR